MANGATQMTRSDRIILDLLNALAAIERTAMSDNSPTCMRIGGMASQARVNMEGSMSRNIDGYLVVTHDRKIDAAVYNGLQEAWRVHSCNINLSDDSTIAGVQKIIVEAVKAGI